MFQIWIPMTYQVKVEEQSYFKVINEVKTWKTFETIKFMD